MKDEEGDNAEVVVPHSWSISSGKKEGDDEGAEAHEAPTAEAGTVRPGLERDGDGSRWSLRRRHRRPNAKEEEDDTRAATSTLTSISTSSGTCSEATARRTCRRRPPSDE